MQHLNETLIIRCDECKHLYRGQLADTVEVYELDATPAGDSEPTKLAVRKHVCRRCQQAAKRRSLGGPHP